MKIKFSTKSKKSKRPHVDAGWECIHPHAAGIDIGSQEHWVCVPAQASQPPVRKFGTFTADLEAIACWLTECGVKTVAMEATGVYWIALFQVLEKHGFTVALVNPRQIKHVSGRKTDVSDCQWIQRLHSYGLLQPSFRPADPYVVLRTYLRYRDELVAARAQQCQHMQKALHQMNIQLTQVLSNITGESGLAIIRALVRGERDETKLAALVNYRVRATQATIRRALRGDYRAEHLFVLQQALELYDTFDAKITVCEEQIAQALPQLTDKVDVAAKPLTQRKPGRRAQMDQMGEVDLRLELYSKFGVDLTAIEGIGVLTALTFLTEVGPDLKSLCQ